MDVTPESQNTGTILFYQSFFNKSVLSFVVLICLSLISFLVSCGSDDVTRPLNERPSPVIGMGDTTVLAYDSVNLRVSTVDNTQTGLKYLWQIDTLGEVDTLSDTIVRVVFENTGIIPVFIRVLGPKGIVSIPDTITVTVLKRPSPVIGMEDTIVCVGDSTNLRVNTVDTTQTGLKYLWQIGESGEVDTLSDTTVRVAFKDTGVVPIFVRVLDEREIVSISDTITVTVLKRPSPVIGMPDTIVCVGDSVNLRVNTIDNTQTGLKYLWQIDTLGEVDTLLDTTVRVAFKDTGVVPIFVRVLDKKGIISIPDTIMVTVLKRPSPVIGMPDTIVCVGDSVNLRVNTIDNTQTGLKYLWQIDTLGEVDTLSDTIVRVAFKDTGIVPIFVRVLDKREIASIPDTIMVTVLKRPSPVIGMPDTIVCVGDSVNLRVNTIDNTQTELKYLWQMDTLGEVDTLSDTIVRVAFKDTGVVPIFVRVLDKKGIVSIPDTIMVTVLKRPSPVIGMGDTTVFAYDSVNLRINTVDTTQTELKYLWQIGESGEVDTISDTIIRVAFKDTGVVSIFVRVLDKKRIVSIPDTIMVTVNLRSDSTRLPTLCINTNDGNDIVSKDTWVGGTFNLLAGNSVEVSCDVEIKGRGNTTWDMPKKCYSLKLDSEKEILGMKEHKRWVLIANYSDKSLLRNDFVSYLGTEIFTNMKWNPTFKSVDLVLNGVYWGVYLIGEQIKIDNNRVDIQDISDLKKDVTDDGQINLDDGGFIVEVNYRLDEIFNFTTTNRVPISLKDPDEVSPEIQYTVKSIIKRAENALYDDNFSNDSLGYAKYFDINSFIDWYLVNEFTRNADAVFWTSVYMYYNPTDKKLYMGPNWDYDISCGNINFAECDDPEGYYIRNEKWMSRLFEDSSFVSKVNARWEEVRTEVHNAISIISQKADSISSAAEYNFIRWPILGTYVWPNADGYEQRNTYQSEVDYLAEWLNNRLTWMNSVFGL